MANPFPPIPIVRPRSRRTVLRLAIVVGVVATCLGGWVEARRWWRGLPYRDVAGYFAKLAQSRRETSQHLIELASDAEELNERWRERQNRLESIALNHLRPELLDRRPPEKFAIEARQLAANCLALADHFAALARKYDAQALSPPPGEVAWDQTNTSGPFPRLPFPRQAPWPQVLERYGLTFPRS